jgi:hypothetical protein
VAKVKKRTGVTGERNGSGTTTGRKAKVGTKLVESRSKKQPTAAKKKGAPKRGTRVKTARGKQAKTARGKQAKTARGKQAKALRAPVVRMAVRPLDPLRKCGPKTTVQLLYRVDEEVDGRNTPHLVFFDRHGWYCEHGRSCPAVGHARKFKGQIARVS